MKTVARTLAGNTVANVTRLAVTSLVSIFLPAYLTHQLPIKTYGAWVLILQLSAYVNYLDFGVQTAVAKYIAEYHAKRDARGCDACASAGLAIMLVASVLGVLLTLILVWRVPGIFRTMPSSFFPDVRLSVLFVGISLSVSLATSVFVAIFPRLAALPHPNDDHDRQPPRVRHGRLCRRCSACRPCSHGSGRCCRQSPGCSAAGRDVA